MKQRPAIWIDLDNAPHAHFFAPLVSDLTASGYEALISVRSFGQTEQLARAYGMNFTTIGNHAALHTRTARVAETLTRAARLVEFGAAHRPVAAVSHGSRALTLAAAFLGIPVMALYDYEHVSATVFHRLCRRVLVPEIVLRESPPASSKCVGYPGLKEDVYVHQLKPDVHILENLGLDPTRLIITVRPPATWAHYHSDHSTTLFRALVQRLRSYTDAQIVMLARTSGQAADLVRDFALREPCFRITSEAVDGLSLICYSDAVFSGGGTMAREAALMGVRSYSTFAGISGAVDRELERRGSLTMLRTEEDVGLVEICKQSRAAFRQAQPFTRQFIVDQILQLIAQG
jgi:predicted glycosyltransferase